LHLPPDIQQRLAEEYGFVAKKMREESDPFRKVYFFSALFTEISRVLNWYWDRDLVLLHWVLQATHANLSTRVQPSSPGRNPELASVLIEPLAQLAEGLAAHMARGAKDDNRLYELIGRAAEIGYLSTQHGGYVMEKGLVKPDSISPVPPSSRSRASARASDSSP
jgi:hypothetical protein